MSVHIHVHDAGFFKRNAAGQFTSSGGGAKPDHWKAADHHRERADHHRETGNLKAERAHHEAYRAHTEAARHPSTTATRKAQGRTFLANRIAA